MRVLFRQKQFIRLLVALPCVLVFNISMAQPKNQQQLRVLIVGGNSSHDFAKWFGEADATTLKEAGATNVIYTEDMDSVEMLLPQTEVLFLSNNKPVEKNSTREAIFQFANRGGGILLGHAATWYNFHDWPEYNERLVGGGAMGHGAFEPFTIRVAKKHPVTKGLADEFTAAADELYFFQPDNLGENIIVLTKSYLPAQPKKFYPSVFIVKHPAARIVGITLGHDGEAHQSQPYKTILRNSLQWIASKK